jgi:hypothetical protein
MKFRNSPQMGLDPGLLWAVGYITHTIKDVSDVLDDADITPFEHNTSAGRRASFTIHSDWDDSDYEKAYVEIMSTED